MDTGITVTYLNPSPAYTELYGEHKPFTVALERTEVSDGPRPPTYEVNDTDEKSYVLISVRRNRM